MVSLWGATFKLLCTEHLCSTTCLIITVTTYNILHPFQSLSLPADYLERHSYNFGKFLRSTNIRIGLYLAPVVCKALVSLLIEMEATIVGGILRTWRRIFSMENRAAKVLKMTIDE